MSIFISPVVLMGIVKTFSSSRAFAMYLSSTLIGGFGAGLTRAAMGLFEDFRASLLAGFFDLGRKEIFAIV